MILKKDHTQKKMYWVDWGDAGEILAKGVP